MKNGPHGYFVLFLAWLHVNQTLVDEIDLNIVETLFQETLLHILRDNEDCFNKMNKMKMLRFSKMKSAPNLYHRDPAGYKTLLKWFNLRGFNEGISYRGVDRVQGAFKR